ncbi:MAG: CBS domain-containing protein [Planctomycetes bacterium]|nr:CBS domain-containing protein [Planctomycetota bacterium]MCB9887796.1 CBS domain-containing protein [Planctomycetota bacterium]
MKIRELMSSPAYSVHPMDSLQRAAELLWEHDVGMLAVVDEQGRVGAAITDRDICMGALTKNRRLTDLRVAEVMSKELISCRADEDVDVAVQRMASHQLHRLPVVDDRGIATGVVTLNDIALAVEGHARMSRDALKALVAVSRHRAKVPAVIPSAPAQAPTGKAATSKPAAKAAGAGGAGLRI